MEYKEKIRMVMRALRTELKDEFDQNFERKGFFGKPWKRSEHGLIDTGDLRKSLGAENTDTSVTIYSDAEYAEIHNEGGKIRVTEKMKKYFWAKYAERKDEKWKAMALKKVGSWIEIPERRFVGDAPEVRKAVEDVLAEEQEEWLTGEILEKGERDLEIE